MHWHLEVTFNEDANKTLDKIAAQNLNIIYKRCLSIIRLFEIDEKKNMSLKRKRRHISMMAEKYLEMIINI